MSAHSHPPAVSLPSLSAHWVHRWVQKTQDLVLLLDDRNHIAGALQDGVYAASDIHHWIGLHLCDVVSPDTRPKIDVLLANDVALDVADDRWRHLNLLSQNGTMLPVLMRYMQVPDIKQPMRTIICRDLRATADLSLRHQSAHREFEQTMLELRDTLHQQEQEIAHLRGQSIDLRRLVDQIKRGGFNQVIDQATQLLRRQCLQTLLDQSGGDAQQAARLAMVDDATWERLTRAAGL